MFSWNLEAIVAFNILKNAKVTAPVLGLPDYTLPFVLKTNVSGTGSGAVLM